MEPYATTSVVSTNTNVVSTNVAAATPATTLRVVTALVSTLAMTTSMGCSPDGPPMMMPADGGDAGVMPVDASTGPIDLPAGGDSIVAPAAVVEQTGSGAVLLKGIVLTTDAVLNPGQVLIDGDSIACVSADCSAEPAAASATVVDTQGIISPGLIDGHNHLSYNFLPEWVPDPPELFEDRYTWADDTSYEAHIYPYTEDRNTSARNCPAIKWGELRSLVHGTTTVMGQSRNFSCLNRLVRNADHHHGLGTDRMQTAIGSPREFTDDDAEGYLGNFIDGSTTRFAVHMAEGTGGEVLLEFDSFAGRDERPNRHMGQSLLSGTFMGQEYEGVAVLIHGVPLTTNQLMEAAASNAKIVWSPSSNIALYGTTASVGEMLDLGLTVGLGPDWTVSGEDDMLAEMRFARQWAVNNSETAVTSERLWQMATFDGANVVGLDAMIGEITVGHRADLVVFGRLASDPYSAIIDSRAEDVRLVFIDGQAYYGDASLSALGLNGDCESLDACGVEKFICVANTPGATGDTARADETYAEIQSQLIDILAMFEREDELLPLFQCE